MNTGARTFQVVDVEQVDANDPQRAVKSFVLDRKPRIVECDVFIAGGGMGGCAAAIRAAQKGVKVCVSEETEWIGGQMTAQGVSALDENKYVETSGATRLYQELREQIRAQYDGHKNPGLCWVSRISFEPKIGLQQLEKLIAEQTAKNKPRFFTRTKVVQTRVERGRVVAALAVNLDTGKFIEFRCRFCIDATELGDLLPMLDIPYSSGAESHKETGEPHAPLVANPENVQDFTYPFVLKFAGDASQSLRSRPLAEPLRYDEFKRSGKFSLLGYGMFTDKKPERNLPFWTYRRLVAKELIPDLFASDISMINWEAHDLRGENLIDCDNETFAKRLALGKSISLGFAYWLQTECERDEGGKGYPEFEYDRTVLGTADGLSKYPYIRESRRIRAKRLIVEQDISGATNGGARAKLFPDSVGIGLYPIDIHGHQDVPLSGHEAKPFQIPFSSMVQTQLRNFLPACKNIGTTHVTNGAYRLHPIEWAIGEAAGLVAALCVKRKARPDTVLDNREKLRSVQFDLVENGSPVFWFSDIATNDPDFAAMQTATITEMIKANSESLEFAPDATATAAECDQALRKLRLTGIEQHAFEGDKITRRELAKRVYAELKLQSKKGVHH